MPGIAQHHFPQIVWRDGEKKLWNPIHKKALKNRPEERVRLRIIEAVVEAGWSRHRISTEEALRSVDNPSGRTDIICYDQDFNPRILIECKAESVSISEAAAEQTARYNRAVDAPYLLMTNGLTDFWYQIDGNSKPERLDSVPGLLQVPDQPPKRAFPYWKERGFAGEKAVDSGLRNWITSVLNTLWRGDEGEVRYIEFNNSPSDLVLKHYFHISRVNGHRIALGILNTPFGGTRMVAVFNRDNQNVGLIEINLDLLPPGTSPNATIYSGVGAQNFDIREQMSLELQAVPDTAGIRRIPSLLDAVFDALN